MIEVLLQIRRDKYKDFTPVVEALDLVEEEDQITHYVSLEDDLETFEKLNVFKYIKLLISLRLIGSMRTT